MFFSDDYDAGAGVDPGAGGFASIFGSGGAAATEDAPETDSLDGATTADDFSPEPDGDLSAEELVAARFAAAAEEDGLEAAEEEETEETEGAADLESLSAAELKALAQEALSIKEQYSTYQEEQLKEGVRQRVIAAEQQAIAAVTQQFEQTVLSRSAAHYDAELSRRIATIARLARTQDDPEAFIVQQSLLATNTVMRARQEWEQEQAADWDARAVHAAEQARTRVPELRALYARDLARHYNLPDAAIADINHGNRDIANFEHRARELADIAATLGGERKKQAQAKRQQANAVLREQPVRTASTGRQAGGKPREYRGTTEELAAMLPFLRE